MKYLNDEHTAERNGVTQYHDVMETVTAILTAKHAVIEALDRKGPLARAVMQSALAALEASEASLKVLRYGLWL